MVLIFKLNSKLQRLKYIAVTKLSLFSLTLEYVCIYHTQLLPIKYIFFVYTTGLELSLN